MLSTHQNFRLHERVWRRWPAAIVPLLLWFLVSLSLTGCGGASRPTNAGNSFDAGGQVQPGSDNYPMAPEDIDTVPLTIGPPPDPRLEDLVYRIGPFDLLRIEVFGVDELSSQGRVNFQGLYTMPLVGAIPLNGYTVDEAEAEIEGILASRYLRNPSVTVYVEDSANMSVTLSGKMNGVVKITGRTSLGQALAAAGGVPPVGKKKEVVIFRATDETRHTPNPSLHAYVVDYQSILKGKERDPLLVGRDRIYVPPSALAIFLDPWLGVFRTYVPVQVTDTKI